MTSPVPLALAAPDAALPPAVLDFLATESAAMLVGPTKGREAARARLIALVLAAQAALHVRRDRNRKAAALVLAKSAVGGVA